MNKWKWLAFGIGFVAGAVATTLVSGQPSPLRKATTYVLGLGLTAKRKVETFIEVSKENLSDIVAEADQSAQDRQSSKDETSTTV
ncbi:MAG: DUF1490 family protein [Deltaproteobacteria bacterium]|jgi:hypothetical protein|nr:DUF1490 family protein [Deltaproteobacteria bacterium]